VNRDIEDDSTVSTILTAYTLDRCIRIYKTKFVVNIIVLVAEMFTADADK